VGMPLLYVIRGSVLAEALTRRALPGDPARAQQLMSVATRLADDVGMGSIFQPRRPDAPALRDAPQGAEVR
jgi:hypothetical protein